MSLHECMRQGSRFEDQAWRKPDSAAAASIANNGAARIMANPLDA
jgi:hypothetical protein